VTKAVLIGAIPPLMLKTDTNPAGLPLSVFDGLRAGVVAGRSQFLKDLTNPFYGYNKPDAKPSQGVRDSFWMQGMQASVIGTYECIKAFSETDLTEDLKKIDVPTLILHGDADQSYPLQTPRSCRPGSLRTRRSRSILVRRMVCAPRLQTR
jgi:non-heme chloroperoxidase